VKKLDTSNFNLNHIFVIIQIIKYNRLISMKLIDENSLKDKIKKFVNDTNNLFNNADDDIKNILKINNINTRNRTLSFRDALCYKFNSVFKSKTQLEVINKYKMDNTIDCNNSAFYRKEKKIPLEYYKNIHEKVLKMYNNYTEQSTYNIIAVDGTYNNTNVKNNKTLETSLNMGYFDVTNDIPIELTYKGEKYKNREIESLIERLEQCELNLSSFILVLDRGYCSYELMKFLEEKNIKFLIRIRNNLKCIKNNNIDNKYRLINYNYNVEQTKELKNKKNDKIEKYNVIINVNCNMITNLNENDFNDEKIREIYNSRWKVEEFFKLVKSNFNFSNMVQHHNNVEISYQKTYYIIQIICILEKIIEKLFIENINTTTQNTTDYNVKMNKTNLINGIEYIINDLIFSKLNINKILILGKTYINFNYCKKNINNPRVSKTPFTKWYVKDYHSKYDLEKILEAQLTEDKSKLNKNLKTKLKNYTFIKIE
jgi:Transposase DDE domain